MNWIWNKVKAFGNLMVAALEYLEDDVQDGDFWD